MTDPISRRLDEAANGVVPHLSPVAAVRARGEQRRRAVRRSIAAGTAAVAVLVIATGAALAGTGIDDRSGTGPLATPTSVASPSANPSASVSPSPRPPRSQPSPPPLPPVSLPPPGTHDTPPATPAEVTQLPDGFAFPEESSDDWGRASSEFKVTRTSELGTAWVLDPCRPTAYPTGRLRTDFYQARRDGPEWREVRQVAVYPSEADAHEVMEGFRRALRACAQRVSTDDVGSHLTQHDTENLDVGDDGLITMSSYHLSFPGYDEWGQSPGSPYSAVVRVGNAIYVAHEYREGMAKSLVDDELAITVRRAAARAAELLCDYNDSCG